MFKEIRNYLSNLIPAQGSTTKLATDFLKWGNKQMYPNWSDVQISDKDHYSGYAFAAIQNRASTVATIAKDNLHTQAKSKAFEHPYLPLIKESTEFSEFWFWIWISVFLDLEGVVYLLVGRNRAGKKTGQVNYFKLLSPYNITPIRKEGSLEIGGYIERRDGMERELPPHMVIPIYELNPFDDYAPFARSDAAKESQFTIKTGGDYTRSSLQSNINAPGILSTGVTLGDEQFKNFVSRVRSRTKGEPIFGNGNGAVDWKDMQVDLNKAGLKDITEQNVTQLLAIYGMSKTTMGIEVSGVTRDTSKVQKGLLLEMHVIPRIQLALDALNLDYKRNYPEEYSVNKAVMTVDNPNTTDNESEKADVEVKQLRSDLYQTLLDKGYKSKIAAKYVKGEIEIDGLGEPTEEPKKVEPPEGEPTPPEKNSVKKKNQMDIIQNQQAVLENAVVNIDGQLVAKAISRIPKIIKNALDSESDLLTSLEKKASQNELQVILKEFYNAVIVLEGNSHIAMRGEELGFAGDFSLDANIRKVLDSLSNKVSKSHIDTISNDIYQSARELALQEKSQQEIISRLTQQFATEVSTIRARAVSRTETNRAFSFSQLEADKQLANQNGFIERAYKKWRTNSANPCPICIQLASEPPIPLTANFRDIGSEVKYSEDGKRKGFKVNFTDLESGCAHTNCSCGYDLVIIKERAES